MYISTHAPYRWGVVSLFGLELSRWLWSSPTTFTSDLFLVQDYWLVSCKKGVWYRGN